MTGDRWVLGAGVSGLLWAFYHPEYLVVTDDLGRAVTGVDPLLLFNYTPKMDRLMLDLKIWPVEVKTKKVGYLPSSDGGVLDADGVSEADVRTVFLKKMVPWEVLETARLAGLEVRVEVPSRRLSSDAGELRYFDVDARLVVNRLAEAVAPRVVYRRVAAVMEGRMFSDDGVVMEYDHLVSTVPAPVFSRLWRGSPGVWVPPRLHYCPVTHVVSRVEPSWWDDEYVLVYDCNRVSPVSRVARLGDRWCYEFTGRPDDDDLAEYLPVPAGRFTNPYGRIVQDVDLSPPPRVTFLGRSARWDYRSLVSTELEIVRESEV